MHYYAARHKKTMRYLNTEWSAIAIMALGVMGITVMRMPTAGRRNADEMSYTDKAAVKILRHQKKPKKGAWFVDGKFMRGTFSTHLSRTGVRYNRLLRLVRRTRNM